METRTRVHTVLKTNTLDGAESGAGYYVEISVATLAYMRGPRYVSRYQGPFEAEQSPFWASRCPRWKFFPCPREPARRD